MERFIQQITGVSEVGLVPAIEISIVLAALLAVVFHRLRQPAIPAYILAGFLLSFFARPVFGGAVSGMEQISHLGLVLLLFIIGLELDIKGLFSLGARTATAALLQAPLAFLVVLGLQMLAGWAGVSLPGLGQRADAWPYFAVAAALSSTAVVVRLLGEKFELATAAGRVTVVTLIAQDIWAVLALSLLFAGGEHGSALAFLRMMGGAVLVAAFMFWLARKLMRRVMLWLARSPDLLAMLAMGWCFTGSGAFSALGLSAEMGALLAGLSLGSLPGAGEILAKVSNLRDFFMALFFIALGMSLPPPTLEILLFAGALVLTVIVVRLLFFSPLLLLTGCGPVVSFAATFNLAQLSEFSLLLIPVGVATGSLTINQASVIAYGLMISLLVSTYLVRYNNRLALAAARRLSMKLDGVPQNAQAPQHSAEVVLLGYFHNTDALVRLSLAREPEMLRKFLVIDYNLKIHQTISDLGVDVRYGDVSNSETLHHYGLERARVVACTISDNFLRGTTNLGLARLVKDIAPQARFIATAINETQAGELLTSGAFAVICPPAEAAPAYLEAIKRALEGKPDQRP